jgi:hypothetical protein
MISKHWLDPKSTAVVVVAVGLDLFVYTQAQATRKPKGKQARSPSEWQLPPRTGLRKYGFATHPNPRGSTSTLRLIYLRIGVQSQSQVESTTGHQVERLHHHICCSQHHVSRQQWNHHHFPQAPSGQGFSPPRPSRGAMCPPPTRTGTQVEVNRPFVPQQQTSSMKHLYLQLGRTNPSTAPCRVAMPSCTVFCR